MAKKSALIVLVVLALFLPFSKVQAVQLMSDGFEDGDYTSNPTWTLDENCDNPTCELNVTSDVPHTGTYSLELNTTGSFAGGEYLQITHDLGSSHSDYSVSFFLYMQSAPNGNIYILEWGTGTVRGGIEGDWLTINSDPDLVFHATGPLSCTIINNMQSNRWQHIEIWENGTTYIYVNGTNVCSKSTDASSTSLRYIEVGRVDEDATDATNNPIVYFDDFLVADEYQGPSVNWVTFYRHTGITQLQVNGSVVANATSNVYANNTLLSLLSTPDIDYSFWRYLIGASYHAINPYTHEVTASTTVHSYASGGAGPVTAQAANWWFLLLGFIMFVSPPFIIAKRWHREAANIVILLFVMVMGLSFMMAGIA